MHPSAQENAAIPLPPVPELPVPDMPAAAAPSPVPAMPPFMTAQPALPTAAGPAAAVPSAGLLADDGDLIEKEWVLKARQIVERTREDPFKQSEDLTLFKADYMRKRYGKTIKVSR